MPCCCAWQPSKPRCCTWQNQCRAVALGSTHAVLLHLADRCRAVASGSPMPPVSGWGDTRRQGAWVLPLPARRSCHGMSTVWVCRRRSGMAVWWPARRRSRAPADAACQPMRRRRGPLLRVRVGRHPSTRGMGSADASAGAARPCSGQHAGEAGPPPTPRVIPCGGGGGPA
jgi:hypothetical protein